MQRKMKKKYIYLTNIVKNPSQEKKSKTYLRKYSAIKTNCCNGNCKRNLSDEPISESFMTCNKCQNKFSQGYAIHNPNVFFCEKCGQENSASGEFKVWI